MISFNISIFALSNTTVVNITRNGGMLWLALKLVSLHYQIQLIQKYPPRQPVVISFKISIFALSNTTPRQDRFHQDELWLALKLVSLHYQIQPQRIASNCDEVVISFKISIFALSNTTLINKSGMQDALWLALKLVSLHYQIQL